MNRTIIIVLLVLSLYQGFLHEEPGYFLQRANSENTGYKQPVPFGETICNPRSAPCFAQIFAFNKQQQPDRARSYRQETSQKFAGRFPAFAQRQNHRSDDAIHPSEWGLIALRLPRSDG